MSIRAYLSTRNIDYAGYVQLDSSIEISDQSLKLHCCARFEEDLIRLLKIDKIEGVRQKVGIWCWINP